MNYLSVTIDLEDFSAGLIGSLELNGFKGSGEGWFNTSEIIAFCDKLEFLAMHLKGGAELIAGQLKPVASGYLETFGLRCYVVARTGTLGVHVTFSECPYNDCRPEEILKVSGELKVQPQSAIEFAQGIRSLCAGSTRKVTLSGQE